MLRRKYIKIDDKSEKISNSIIKQKYIELEIDLINHVVIRKWGRYNTNRNREEKIHFSLISDIYKYINIKEKRYKSKNYKLIHVLPEQLLLVA